MSISKQIKKQLTKGASDISHQVKSSIYKIFLKSTKYYLLSPQNINFKVTQWKYNICYYLFYIQHFSMLNLNLYDMDAHVNIGFWMLEEITQYKF